MRRFSVLPTLLLALSMLQAGAANTQDWLGVNLQNPRDFQSNDMFADAMKSSRGWGSPTTPWDLSAPLDANGWPTQDAGVVVKTGRIANIGGTYSLSFTGRATVASLSRDVALRNLSYSAATNSTSGEVVVDNTATGIMLSFTGTTGGVRNVKLIRPGHSADETFNRAFLELIRPFRSLRFMWTTETIDNPVVRWQDRTLPSYATMNRQFNGQYAGTAWEYCIELCNLMHKDMWICVPDQADDDYVTQLATLLKNSVNPDVNIYVEYSNEVWNNGYRETRRNSDAAQAEVASGRSNLNFDGETNPAYLAWRRVGLKTKQISDSFRRVFGDAAMMSRIRPVLAMWVAVPMSIRQPLEYLEAVYGPPKDYLYGIACAPYFGVPAEQNDRTDLTVDDCVNFMQQTLTESLRMSRAYSAWAQWYGLKFMMYEGGIDMHGAGSLDNKIAAQRDPRTAALLRQFYDGCNAIGLDHLSFFTSISADGIYGMDGLTTRLDDLNHPKYQAMLQAVTAPQAPITIGAAVPGVVQAGSFDLQSGFNPGGTAPVTLNSRNWYNYIVRVPAAGIYALTPSVNGVGTGGIIEALTVNGAVQSWNVGPSTGAYIDLSAASVELRAGLNEIRVRSLSGTVSLRSINIGAVAMPLTVISTPTATPDNAAIGQSVSFNAAFSGNGVSVIWNFGDGSRASDASVSHVFAAAGVYTVRATATDALGQTLSADVSVTVTATMNPPPPPPPPPVSQPPVQPPAPEHPLAPEPSPNPPAPEDDGHDALPLEISMMKGSMLLSGGGGDSCQVIGSLADVPVGAISAGEVVTVGVGDCETSFTLSSRGVGKSVQGTIALKLPKNGTSNAVGFKLTLKHVSLMQKDFTAQSSLPMKVSISIHHATFASNVNVKIVQTPKAMKFSR